VKHSNAFSGRDRFVKPPESADAGPDMSGKLRRYDLGDSDAVAPFPADVYNLGQF